MLVVAREKMKNLLRFIVPVLVFCFWGVDLASPALANQEDYICMIYFTGIGCRHCEMTTPLVLEQLPRDYPNLVVIEYEIYGKEGNTLVYSYEGKIDVQIGEGSRTLDISLKKESATISGTTSFDGSNIANISIAFTRDLSVYNNTAISASVTSDETGSYTIELAPGTYNVTVDHPLAAEGQTNYSYKFSGELVITTVPSTRTYDIVMSKAETD